MDAISMLIKFSFADNAQIIVARYMPTKIIMPMMARICLAFFIIVIISPFFVVVRKHLCVDNETMVADFRGLVK